MLKEEGGWKIGGNEQDSSEPRIVPTNEQGQPACRKRLHLRVDAPLKEKGSVGPLYLFKVSPGPFKERLDVELTPLDPLLVHDSAPALATPDGLPRLDCVRRSAVCRLVDGWVSSRSVRGPARVGRGWEQKAQRWRPEGRTGTAVLDVLDWCAETSSRSALGLAHLEG